MAGSSRSRPGRLGVVAGGGEGAACLGELVPGASAVGALDRALVALAGEQHRVARPGGVEGRGDRRTAVRDGQEVLPAPTAGRLGAPGDLVEDRLAVLAARILVRDDDEPRA